MGCELQRKDLGPATFVLGIDSKLGMQPDGYRLSIDDQRVTIVGQDAAGLFYGVCTLQQWIGLHRWATATVSDCDRSSVDARGLSGVEIDDWPDYANRGVLLDISRDKVPTAETLERLVDRLSSWKINQLQLYMEHTFAYSGHEVVWRDASPMWPEEIRALDALCRERFVELVPNQNSFGHFHRWLVHAPYRHLAECPEGIDHPFSDVPEPFSLCPVDPGATELLSQLYEQLLPNFSSGMFNVGLDETLDLGRCRSAEACQRSGKEEVYLQFLLRVHALVLRHGHKMQFWDDIVIKRPDLLPRLPQGVIALEWGYEPDHPFDSRALALAQAGVPFYLCPGTSSWNSLAGRAGEALLNIARAARSGLPHAAEGLLLADWGDNGHLQPLSSSYLGLLAGAAAAWNAACCATEQNIAELLDYHVFADDAGRMGQAVVRLGTAHQLCGAVPINGTVLFRLLVSPDDPLTHTRYRGLSVPGLAESREKIDEALSLLHAARPAAPDASLCLRELGWVGQLLRLACKIGIARLSASGGALLSAVAPSTRHAFADELAPLVADHAAIWLARNRPGGWADSRRRLDHLHQLLVR